MWALRDLGFNALGQLDVSAISAPSGNNLMARTSGYHALNGGSENRCHMTAHQLHQRLPRPLTFDERQAAEAAFSGKPFCATWSASAQRVYEGLIAALVTRS